MADPYVATQALLTDRPEIEDALTELLEADKSGPWSFDDVDVDSGTFGELVSQGIVTRVDAADAQGEYRLADRMAVQAAVQGESHPGEDERTTTSVSDRLSNVRLNVQFPFLAALVASLGFLFVLRIVNYDSVFREEVVVFPANDPYHYRHWIDQLLAAEPQPFDLPAIAETLGGRATGQPFVYTLGYWVTGVFESNPETAGAAVAWIPVGAALIVGVSVAWMALVVTGDERVAVLSVLALALTSQHSVYTSLGFIDHQPLNPVWLAVMAAAFVWLARDVEQRVKRTPDTHDRNEGSTTPVRAHLQNPVTWVMAGCFGIAVVLSVFTWNGAPVLLTGVATYIVLRAGMDIRVGHSPMGTAAPIAAGLALASGLAYAIHTWAGWQEPAVVFSPALVLGGLVVVTGIAEGCLRSGAVSPRTYVAGVFAGTATLLVATWRVAPDVLSRLAERMWVVVEARRYGESRRLLATEFGFILGGVDVFGWLLFIAFPMIAAVCLYCLRSYEPRWLVLCGFALPMVVFSLLEIRFVAKLAVFTAVFTAAGTVWILARIDLLTSQNLFGTRPRYRLTRGAFRPSATAVYVAGALLLLASLSLILVPATTSSIMHEDGQVEAAMWMSENAETTERSEFVAASFGDQRFYNYFVFGESDTYSTSVQADIEELYMSTDPDAEYDRFDSGVGYLVLDDLGDVGLGPESGHARLIDRYGAATDEVDGVGHYRVEFVSADGGYLVISPVPGATIEGPTDAEERFMTGTDVEAGSVEFRYTRQVKPDDGRISVTVAHPGSYDVDGETVAVTEEDVSEGATIEVGER